MKAATMKTMIVGLAVSLSANAFAANSDKFSIAPQVGMTLFKVMGSGLDSKAGSTAGMDVLIPLGVEGLRLQTGLNYLETGAKTSLLFASAEFDLRYLTLPVLANWTFYQTSGRTDFYMKGGGIISQVVSAKAKTTVFGTTDEQDIKDQVNSNDILFTAGLGFTTEVFGDWRAGLDMSYVKGTKDVFKAQEGLAEGYVIGASMIIPL